jgi:fructose-1,6-bisphosphatase/inositol monophosphatase family enzyme
VLYNPISNELYCAQKGEGAFFNQKKLRLASFNNAGNINKIATDNYFIKKDSNILNHNIIVSNCAQLDICHISSNKINQVCLAKPYHINTIGGSLLIASEAGINIDIKTQDQELETTINQIILTQNVKS